MYELEYNKRTGKATVIKSINPDGSVTSFKLDSSCADYSTFLKWNAGKPAKDADPDFVYRPKEIKEMDLSSIIE